MSERIYLASPHMGGSERRYVDLAFDTNWIAPLGANVTGFEQDLQQYLGAGYVTALSAGTAALEFELEQQKHELDEHVRREEYEAAAICRDRISQLKTELEAQKKAPDSPEEEQPEKEAEHE